MKQKYIAAFLVPIGAVKLLREDGWEFESSQRLSKDIAEHLIEELKLDFVEMYLGIKRYVGNAISMSIFLDDDNEVENIYFQVFGHSLKALTELCQDPRVSSKAEMFVPEKE
ncbi:hypothetical protein [Pseudomonas sp. W5-36]|uniref:hypothetical protein n=1 Tax=Pseudomonas sp. W5-36 TaxID=3097455 RepID=UPI003979AC81